MSHLDLRLSGLGMLGVRIFSSPLLEPKPKLKLSESCPVSDEFRAEMDAWLLDRFGTDTDNVAIQVPGGLVVAPSVLRALRETWGAA